LGRENEEERSGLDGPKSTPERDTLAQRGEEKILTGGGRKSTRKRGPGLRKSLVGAPGRTGGAKQGRKCPSKSRSPRKKSLPEIHVRIRALGREAGSQRAPEPISCQGSLGKGEGWPKEGDLSDPEEGECGKKTGPAIANRKSVLERPPSRGRGCSPAEDRVVYGGGGYSPRRRSGGVVDKTFFSSGFGGS